VFSAVSQGLAWDAGAARPAAVKKAAISSLRIRIGAQPLADLVRRCCVPLADAAIHPGAFYRGLRLVGIDGSTFELAEETGNDEAFGRPGGRQGPAGYPPRQNSCRPDRTDGPDGFQVLVVDGGRRLWSLWAKAGAVGNA